MFWSILDTGSRDGFMNMAIDEALLLSVKEGRRGPTIRFYQWQPPAISLGYFQSAQKEVNLSHLEEKGITLVRRLTGGRTVLHQYELTYSIILPESMEGIPQGIISSYALLSQGILEGLQSLGLSVVQKKGVGKGYSSACFDAPSWYEIQLGTKKIAGSAQIRRGGVLLQHGSIPFQLDTYLLFYLLHFSSTREREKKREIFEKKATAINQELTEEVSYEELRSALLLGWEKSLSFQGIWGDLSSEELVQSEELKEEKYRSSQWNFLR